MESRIEIILSNGDKAGTTLKELTKQSAALNKSIKDLDPATKEFADKAEDLQKVNAKMGDIRTQIKGTTEASNALKDSFNRFVPFSGTFNQVGEAITGAKGSVGGLTGSFGLLRTAIIATGIGALVVLIGSVVAWFTRTERGADLLAKGLAAAGAVVNVFVDRASKLIDALIALSNGDFEEAQKKFGEATTGVVEEIKKETQAAWDLADAMDALEERQNNFILTEAKAKREASELAKVYEDQSQKISDRTRAVMKAMELEKGINKEKLEMQKEEIRLALQLEELTDERLQQLIEQGVKLEEVGMSESMEDDRKKAIEAIAKYIDLQGAATDKETELIKKLNLIKKKERTADTKDQREAEREKEAMAKAEQDRIKQLEESWKEYYDNLRNLQDMNIQAMDAGREKDLAKLGLDLQRQIEALDVNAPFYAERLAAAQELARMKRDEINQKWDQKEVTDELAKEMNILNQRMLLGQINEETYQLQAEQLAIDFQARKMEQIRAAHGETSAEYQKEYAEYLAMQQAASDHAVAIKEKEVQDIIAATTGSLDVFGNFFGALAAMQEEGSEQAKSFAVAQAWMSTFQSAINAYQSTVQIPVVGPVLAPVAAATAFAFGVMNVRKIENTKAEAPTKAERGLLVRGRRHSQGGEHGRVRGSGEMIEFEDHEIILNRNVGLSPWGRKAASDLNARFGGRKFETGGPVSSFAASDRAPMPSGSAGQSAELRLDRLEAAFTHYAKKVDTWASTLKVQNVVTETRDAMNVINTIEDDANV